LNPPNANNTDLINSLVKQPEKVHLEKAIVGSRHLPLSPRYIGVTGEDKTKGVLFCSGITGNEESGTHGDPRMARKEDGEKSLNAVVNDLADIIAAVANLKK
jgi:creatinine amidohydrolase/Fe(II)-dependent formamide hydrolase-like protein